MVQVERRTGEPITLVCLADVEPIRLDWLWAERFPLGKLTLLVGDPDLGKSMVTLSMAATISLGAPWPDAPDVPQSVGSVVMLSAEDDPSDTIRPRLDALGADCNRIHLLQSLSDVGRDIDQLREAIDRVENCRLVVIDPAPAYMGKVDTHKDADVRRVLMPLVNLAAEKRVALVLVMHLNKREAEAMYRTSGSIAFVAAARAVWAVSADPNNPRRRIMTLVKNNLTADRTGLAYRIEKIDGALQFSWEREPVTMTASEALAPRKRGPSPDTRNKAADWLRGILAGGPKPAQEILDLAAEAGHKERTVYRAFKELAGHSELVDGGAVWSLAASLPSKVAGEQPDKLGNPGTSEVTWHTTELGNLDKLVRQTPTNGHVCQVAKYATLSEAQPNLAEASTDDGEINRLLAEAEIDRDERYRGEG